VQVRQKKGCAQVAFRLFTAPLQGARSIFGSQSQGCARLALGYFHSAPPGRKDAREAYCDGLVASGA